MRALVVADGDVPSRAALDASWPGWSDDVDLVVAADGGAVGAANVGFRVDLLVGDMDSIAPERLAEFRTSGVEVRTVPAEKDESDTELALVAALERGARSVTVLGAFGGPRLDHALANVGLLAMPSLAGVAVDLLDARTRVSAIVAPDEAGRSVERRLAGRVGDLVSLLPLGGDVEGIATTGLRYQLSGETLRAGPARGLSNVRTAAEAGVSVGRGFLVVVETAVGNPEHDRGDRAPSVAERAALLR